MLVVILDHLARNVTLPNVTPAAIQFKGRTQVHRSPPGRTVVSLLEFEHKAWEQGFARVAGVDEAGRGPLAGPVVAGAVVLDRAFAERERDGELFGLTDSKKLAKSKRDYFHLLLTESSCVAVGIGISSVAEIDSMNILRATHLAMKRALENLYSMPDYALIDGLPVVGLPCDSTAIVRGDARSLSVAAASIVAKVTRDRIMLELDRAYPGYGFAGHKGYGTRQHMKALLESGPCSEHRRSFQPVKDAERIVRLSP